MIINLGSSGGINIEIIANGTTYRYTGTEINNSYFKISPSGTNGWKMWIYKSLSVKFYYPAVVDICAIGAGNSGGYASPGYPAESGGEGGRAGEIVNSFGVSLDIATDYEVVVGSGASTISKLSISAAKGGGAAGGGGAHANDAAWPSPTYTGPGSGGAGSYAFNDSTFDGVTYAHGGAGGDTPGGGGGRGTVYSWPGSGGAGGGINYNYPTSGIDGIAIMRSA